MICAYPNKALQDIPLWWNLVYMWHLKCHALSIPIRIRAGGPRRFISYFMKLDHKVGKHVEIQSFRF